MGKFLKNPAEIKLYLIIKPYKACNTLIYKILFDLSKSSKITLFKDIFGEIIEVNVTENNYNFSRL